LIKIKTLSRKEARVKLNHERQPSYYTVTLTREWEEKERVVRVPQGEDPTRFMADNVSKWQRSFTHWQLRQIPGDRR